MATFNELGYKCFPQVLNAKNYGIPQHRERIFIVGFKDKSVDFRFPDPIPLVDKTPKLTTYRRSKLTTSRRTF
jgi:DNA (cytosine-5)-methyltransferase 1